MIGACEKDRFCIRRLISATDIDDRTCLLNYINMKGFSV